MNIIYTCITGGYDLLNPITVPEGWKAICFTDTETGCQDSMGWEIQVLEESENLTQRGLIQLQRMVKIMPQVYLPFHKKSVWLDGNLKLIIPIEELVKDKAGYWVMEHPDRTTVKEEAEACIRMNKDDFNCINNQLNFMMGDGYPDDQGMVATGIMIRDCDPKYTAIAVEWVDLMMKFSIRDQLSFNYAAWKNKLTYNKMPFLYGVNKNKHNQRAY